ncbi:MAG: glycosyltransferase family 4 protein [Anaerolineae bacterium]|nr:glycosyltransferase family 4 protein [Anaerolineae bacterium]
MIRLAMLGPYPIDPGAVAGGVDAVVKTLVHALARLDDLDIHVVTAYPGHDGPTTVETPEATVHVVPRHRLDRLLFYRRDVAALRRAIERIGPDVVHAHGAGMIYADAAIGCGRPALITLHGVIFREAALARGWRSRLRWQIDALYERYCVRRARHVIAISPYIQEEYRHLLRGRVYALENPIDDRFFADAGDPEPGLVVSVARVIPRKGILELLAAFRYVVGRIPEARLEIAGHLDADPAYVAQCQSYVAAHGLGDHVRF